MFFYKLFFVFAFFIFSSLSFATQNSNNNGKNINKTVKNTNGKNQQKKATNKNGQKIKKQIRKSIDKDPNDTIRTADKSATTASSYQLSNRVINLKSPMCKYAKNNDVVSLKKALLSSKYSSEEVNTICENGESLFMIAVKNNNFLTSKFLIEKGADVNLQNEAGASPLHIISRNNSKEMQRIFDLLLYKKELDVNVRDQDGYTPIMRAVEFERVDFVEKILKFNVNLNIKNAYGKNVFELADKVLEGKKNDNDKNNIQQIIKMLSANK